MADIFAILGQAAAPRTSLSATAGTSIQDLEKHLRDLLQSKVSPEKAERLSFTYDIASGARFTVSLSQSENDVLDGLGGIDPVLGGARSSEAPDGPQLERVIPAYDTIMNQPQDNPALQRMVAKHIIGTVGACDGSSWTVREVSRGPQGWSFTYICKDSMQSWRRQNAKSMQNVVVGEYSEKERDPVSSSRPAFDCGGTVVISFSRGSKNITVKYKHTPFHKTVAELYELFAPPAPPMPPVNTATPKPAKSSRKRDGPNGNGEGSSRKKPRKKSSVGGRVNGGDAAEAAPGADGAVVDGQGAGDTNQPDGTPQPKRKRQYKRKKKQSAAAESGQAAEGENGDAASHLNTIVNVDAEEAARRRAKATEILSSAGVEPDTLSTDQFNIFANQSPVLQQESLAMLVQYGAERLRIVHPNKDSSAQDQDAAAAPASTAEAPTAAEVEAGAATETANAPASRPKRQKVSRGSCTNCRGQKGVKCGREKPACQNCVDAGVDCSYPLQKSRANKPKSDAEVADEADETSMMDTQHDGDTTQLSVGDQTINSVDLPTTDDQLRPYPSADHDQISQLDGQDDFPNEAPMEQQDHDVAQPVPEQTFSHPAPPQPEPESEPEPEAYREPVAAPRPKSRSTSRGSRRSLPAGRRSQESSEYPSVVVPRSPETPSWGTVNPSSLAASQPQPRHARILQSPPVPTAQMQTHGYQDIQNVAALSSAALQTTQSPQAKAASLQNQARRSPYQAAAAVSNPRASSRQGHRGQSQTPVQDATPLRPPMASASRAHPPAQQPSAPSQSPPATTASYQNLPSVSNISASRSPDAATYNAASSLSGLGNYGFGNFPPQSEGDQGGSRIGYEPYSNHPVGGNQSYTSYDNFSRTNTPSVRMPTTSAQTNTSGYATSSSMSTSRWPSQGTSLPGTSAPTPSSHAPLPAQTQSHGGQAHFNRNVTQTPNNAYPNPSNPYAQKPQQQQQQQQAQAPYNPQQQNPTRAAQLHQRPQQNHHQQNWYGLNNPGAAGGDYRRGAGGYVSGSYAQQGGMGMGGYGGDGDLIDLLGSVHPRT